VVLIPRTTTSRVATLFFFFSFCRLSTYEQTLLPKQTKTVQKKNDNNNSKTEKKRKESIQNKQNNKHS
jgi:hypothetical protein